MTQKLNFTRQEAFNMAAKHLLSTGKPSGIVIDNGSFYCTYSGSGCALRPFLEEVAIPLTDLDGYGSIDEIPSEVLPEFITEDIKFFDRLQAAHDVPSATSGTNRPENNDWLDEWKLQMKSLANAYHLDASILDAA